MAPVADADDEPSEGLPDGNDNNTITIRIVGLQSQPEKEKEEPKTKDIWDRLQVLSAFIMPVVLGWTAWVATGKVETYIKRQQLAISSAKEMMSTLAILVAPKSKPAEVDSAAVILASFGEQAVLPLLLVLQNPDPTVGRAATKGLLLLASSEQDTVCGRVEEFFFNHPNRYTVDIHPRFVELLSDAECRISLAALRKYQDTVERIAKSLDPIAKSQDAKAAWEAANTFASPAELDLENTRVLREAVDKAVQVLNKGTPPNAVSVVN